MSSNVQLANRNLCTGCMACEVACHNGCISSDKKAIYYYPVIDVNKCVGCGQCIKACPVINHTDVTTKPSVIYAAWNKDEKKREISTSGGVAYALEEAAIANGFKVCGAAFNSDYELCHSMASTISEIRKFRGSKYLQSNITVVLDQIRDVISKGIKVLFVGTPCQIDALYHSIHPKWHSKLYTVEIICHGVNSHKIWAEYKRSLERKFNSKLVDYNFRDKSKGWGKLRVEYRFENGKRVNCGAGRNLFHIWFGKHLILRRSCLNCKYRREERIGDLIIGDFWGIDQVSSDLFSKQGDRGISVLMKRTEKGQILLDNTNQLDLCEVPYESICHLKGFLPVRNSINNHELDENVKFEKCYIEKGFDYVAKKYPIPSYLYVYGHKILTLIRICRNQLLKLLS